MADNKKYYYLKLKDNFFDSDEMIILESMPDGYIYSNILLKLYLRSLKYQGRLMFNDKIPFNSTMLAQVTRHSVGDVEKSIRIFNDLGLIEVLDNGAIYLADIQNFIGESSTEADRKRGYRQRIELESLASAYKKAIEDENSRYFVKNELKDSNGDVTLSEIKPVWNGNHVSVQIIESFPESTLKIAMISHTLPNLQQSVKWYEANGATVEYKSWEKQ